MATFDKNGFVTELEANEIFVFGANSEGAHGAGAAKHAHDKAWTKTGHNQGLMWQSYAVDTMSGLTIFDTALKDLAITANHNPSLTFLLTPVGTGIAGYTKEQVEEMLPELPSNVTRVGW